MKGPFSVDSIERDLSTPAGGKKKTKKSASSSKDRLKITRVVETLLDIGMLGRKRGSLVLKGDARFAGKIRITSSGSGTVKTNEGIEFEIPSEHTGRAHHGDTVEVVPIDIRRDGVVARVVSVTGRARERYAARVDSRRGSEAHLTIIDMPGNMQALCRNAPSRIARGDIAFITLEYDASSHMPLCRIEQHFPSDEERCDADRIIARHSLPSSYKDIPDIGRRAAPAPRESDRERKDYRALTTVTIDGATAKDFDDAVSLERKNGNTVLYVHIADVSAYVEPGSPLDREALSRGTSYYLGNRVIPMLPEILSNDMCSLVAGKDRFTLTAELTLDSEGRTLSSRFHRGVIKVDKRLTYENAAGVIAGKSRTRVASMLRAMSALAESMKRHRMSKGRVDLTLTDQEIIYHGETTADIRFAARLSSHMLIEEFMLTANEAASKTLREKNIPALYRIHEDISMDKLFALKSFLATIGIQLRDSDNTGLAIQSIVDGVAGGQYQQVVNMVVLKSFMQAFYGVKPVGHFGLGFRDYTHFTSPIRRYPDLVVHRCIKSIIDSERPPYTEQELVSIAERSSETERIAQSAERDFVRLKSCRLMSGRIGGTFDVVVSGVSRYGMYVSMLEKPVEGFIPLRALTDDFYLVNEDDYTIIGRRFGRRFRLGDKIKARLTGADIYTSRIDFDIA